MTSLAPLAPKAHAIDTVAVQKKMEALIHEMKKASRDEHTRLDFELTRCKNVNRILFDQFCNQLVRSFNKCKKKGLDIRSAVFLIPKDDTLPEIATASSWWVLSLLSELVDEFRIQPRQIVFGEDEKSIADSGASQFVYVDDAMYSGTNACTMVEAWIAAMKGKVSKLFVLVPYSTSSAMNRLRSNLSKGETDALISGVCENIPSVYELTGATYKEEDKEYDDQYVHENDSKSLSDEHTFTYFDHKFPDDTSTDQEIAKFIRCDEKSELRLDDTCILPPYKNTYRPVFPKEEQIEVVASQQPPSDAYYVVDPDLSIFQARELPESSGTPLVKWSHLLVPGASETYASKLPADAVFAVTKREDLKTLGNRVRSRVWGCTKQELFNTSQKNERTGPKAKQRQKRVNATRRNQPKKKQRVGMRSVFDRTL